MIARRLGWWAEHLNLLDENQAGFRKGRSTADVTQMMVRIEEDVSDMGYQPPTTPAPDRETAEPTQDMPTAENPHVSEASADDADLDYFKKLAETA